MRNRYALAIVLACAPGGEHREVRIGLLLPADEALARETSRGARAAVDLLRAGGAAVRIVERRVKGPWGSEAGEMVKLVYDDGVAAVVTAPDRNSSHLAAQVAAKARIPVVVGSGAGLLTRIPLPWVLRVVHGERAALASLLAAVPSRPADGSLAVVVDEGREGERLAGEIRRASRRAGWGDPRRGLPGREAVAVLVAAAPRTGGRAIRAIRASGFRGTLLLLPGPGQAADLLREAGEAAEGAFLPRGEEPAAAAHDAVLLLARGLRATDGSPERVLQWILAAPSFQGATGRIELDAAGDRAGPVPLTVVRTKAEEHP